MLKTVVFGGFRGFRAPAVLVAPDGLFQLLPLEKGLKGPVLSPPPRWFHVVSCGFMWFHVVMSCSSMWSGGPKRWFRGFRAPAVLVAPDGLFQLLPLEKGSKRVRFDPPPKVVSCGFMWFHVVSCSHAMLSHVVPGGTPRKRYFSVGEAPLRGFRPKTVKNRVPFDPPNRMAHGMSCSAMLFHAVPCSHAMRFHVVPGGSNGTGPGRVPTYFLD